MPEPQALGVSQPLARIPSPLWPSTFVVLVRLQLPTPIAVDSHPAHVPGHQRLGDYTAPTAGHSEVVAV